MHEENDTRCSPAAAVFLAAMLVGGFLLAGCSEPGPAEQAGQEIDEAAEDTREALEDMRREAEQAFEEREGRDE